MDKFSYILPFLSTLVVILAIAYDGKLVTDSPKSIFKRIKTAGYVLIIITFFLNFYQFFSSENALKETKELSRNKELKDSSRIAELQKLAEINISKSDSIQRSVVDNAVKALEEQRLINERERENAFIHFQKEVKQNLSKILINYDDKHIRGFTDTTGFISTRLNNTYIKQYGLISSKRLIIEHLMKTSESIDKVNLYAEEVLKFKDKKDRKLNINMFLKNKSDSYKYLLFIFERIYKLKTYKQYESLDFSTYPADIDSLKLRYLLSYELSGYGNNNEIDYEFTK